MNSKGKSALSELEGNSEIRMLDIPRSLSKPSSYGKDQSGFSLSWTRTHVDNTVNVYCGADGQTPQQLSVDSW